VSGEAPYVGLSAFGEEDAALFFGRDGERRRIASNLRASRLTLLYAQSGVGKSSLLRAGVAARLRLLSGTQRGGRAGWMPVVFSSWEGDPRSALLDALEDNARRMADGDGGGGALRRDSLAGAIEDAGTLARAKPLVILDQFEDHLYRDRDGAEAFDAELAECVNRHDLNASFLIAIREDAYSGIGDRFKALIPNVYGNFLHLDHLDERAARDAILGPLDVMNARLRPGEAPIEIDEALVDVVLTELPAGGVGSDGAPDARPAGQERRVATPYLQLVMRRLWDAETAAGSRRLRIETLRDLGGPAAIVDTHVDDALAELPDEQQDACAAAFRFLVTSSGRKTALSTRDLAELTGYGEDVLDAALERLEDRRLLRVIPSADASTGGSHEIYHDVLGPAITRWRRRHDEEAARAQAEGRLAAAAAHAAALERRNRRLAAAVVALGVFAAALALLLWNPDPVRRLELATVDARFRLGVRGSPPPGVVLVRADDDALAPDGFGRGEYARLVSAADRAGARAIAVDVAFDVPSANRAGTLALVGALQRARAPVVIGFTDFTVDPDVRLVRKLALGEGFAGRFCTGEPSPCAYLGVPDDPDGRNRRFEYSVPLVAGAGTKGTGEAPAPLIPFAAAVARSADPDLDVDGLPRSGRLAWEDQTEETGWIDFRGAPGRVPSVDGAALLGGDEVGLADKVVVIGDTTAGIDLHDTPYGEQMKGPELQAAAIATVLDGARLRSAPIPLDLALILLGAVAGPVAILLFGLRWRAAAAVVAAAILIVAAAGLFFAAGLTVAAVLPLAALLTGAAASAAVALARRSRGDEGTRAGRADGKAGVAGGAAPEG
jgi:CHASE2 domain-containing sensor protein